MKMSKADYATLATAVDNVLIATVAEARCAYHAAGLSDRRFVWDVYWATKVNLRGYQDTHIETAMRRILDIPR